MTFLSEDFSMLGHLGIADYLLLSTLYVTGCLDILQGLT